MKNKFFVFILLFFCGVANAAFEDEYKTQLDYIAKLTPITFEINQEVLLERSEIEKINLKNLNENDKKLLDSKAEKYDVFTRFKDDIRYEYLKEKLLEKIDILSPSLLIAISGIETDWGRSRILKDANSLYKEIVWDNSGLKPEGENQDNTYTIKKFNSLDDSMRSFLLKINSENDFEHLRYMRSLYRLKHEPMQGRSVAHNFNLKTPLNNYTGMLDYTITFFELDEIDRQNNYFK